MYKVFMILLPAVFSLALVVGGFVGPPLSTAMDLGAALLLAANQSSATSRLPEPEWRTASRQLAQDTARRQPSQDHGARAPQAVGHAAAPAAGLASMLSNLICSVLIRRLGVVSGWGGPPSRIQPDKSLSDPLLPAKKL